MGTWLSRAIVVGVIGVSALGASLTATPRAVAAEGMDVRSDSTYVVDVVGGAIHGTITQSVTHNLPDRAVPGGIEYTYLDMLSIPIAASSTNVVATSGGGALTVRTVPDDDPSVAQAEVTLPSRLRYGQSVEVVLTFDLVGSAPRSADRTRVGADYASFGVYAFGDDGQTSVTITAPAGWTADATSSAFEMGSNGDQTTLTATTNTAPSGIFAEISLRNPDTPTVPLTVGASEFVLNPWPGDTAWQEFVSTGMSDGLPVLEGLIGHPWPIDATTTVREDAATGVLGYDGWFDLGRHEVTLAEELDAHVLYHELAHAWLSENTFSSRWIGEGFAEYVAARTTDQLGREGFPAQEVSRSGENAVALDDWGDSPTGRATATDDYAYPASRQVVVTMLAGLSDDQVTEVLSAAATGQTAYLTQDAGEVERLSSRQVLDLVQDQGQGSDVESLFVTWVFDDDTASLLAPRAAARTDYAALDTADGDWLPPQAVRLPMARWDFAAAEARMAEFKPVVTEVVAVQNAATVGGIPVPAAVRATYEEAGGDTTAAEVVSGLRSGRTAVEGLADAARISASGNPLTHLGAVLLQVPTDAEHAAAVLDDPEASSAEVAQAYEEAAAVGTAAGWAGIVGGVIVGVVILLLAAGIFLAWFLVRRLRATPAHQSMAVGMGPGLAPGPGLGFAPEPGLGGAPGSAAGPGLQDAQHAGVAQGVGLDPFKVEELRDPLVVGPQELGVDLGGDRLPLDRREAMPSEEVHLEGQAEQPADAQALREGDQ